MPVRSGKDKKGKFMRWGSRGKKYYYGSEKTKPAARSKAIKQGQAAHAGGYK